VFWGALAALVLIAAVLAARRRLRRLSPSGPELPAAGRPSGERPQALEREADAAEARGAFAEAIRLRFRAGLLTLGRRDAIDYRASLRTAEVSRTLRSPEFDSLAQTFERVAYGGSQADAREASETRERWKRVVAGASR
jgi:hypothetical protein